METGKPGLVSAPVHISSVAAQTEKRMDTPAPLTAVYIHTVPALPAQPYPPSPATAREPATLHLAMPPLYSKETLPFLTLHIAGGLQSQPGLSLAAAAPAARPKSAGKHVCPHCGRDCMKPSVLEKHLRCHTGERPYPCTTCGVSFKTQSNLYKHKRTQAHARLSSESEQSSQCSLDSMSGSRETCTSSLSMDERSEGGGSMEKDPTLPAAEITCPASTAKVYSVKTQGPGSERTEFTSAGHKTKELSEGVEEEKQRMEKEKPPLTATSRHLPLQRQEATLFSKQWESSASRGKSQSHESTDSGFSESSDHYPSPGSVLPDHSMDSLTESTKEHLEETTGTQTLSEPGQSGQQHKDSAKEQEAKTLEERISKLISENTAVVEDKQLENVRPRKTVLSKQGSIDLPMPYTYKDSFHFDMRISKTPNVELQRNRKPGLYSSVPSQCSTTMEHAPLTRSNSLPFSVTLLQPERNSPTTSYQSDYVTLVRRGSSGQINPTGFAIKPVNQQSSTHRPLVRQTAVDCNHATDGLFMNSSVEEACTSSLSCDGDGVDICGEPSNRKFRRKKAQKFAYNKWYMYGGGTFKKLYSTEKSGDESVIKGRKPSTNPEHEVVQGLQKRLSAVHNETVTTAGSTVSSASSSAAACHPGCPPPKLPLVPAVDLNPKSSQLHAPCSSLKAPLRRNLSLSILPLPSVGSLLSHKTDSMGRTETGGLINEGKHTDCTSSQLSGAHIPSDRKKQKTDDKIICPLEMETDPNTLTHPPPSVPGSAPQQDTNLSYISLQKNQKHTQFKGALFPPCIINANTPSVSTSPATSTPSAAKSSFLPKYQLKLPNAAESVLNPSPHIVAKPTGTDGHNFISALPSSHPAQTSVTTSGNKCSDSVASPLMQSSDIKPTNAFSSTQSRLPLTCTAAVLCQAETSRLCKNAASTLAVMHRQFATTTITTTCLQDYQAGICSTSIQPSNSAGGSAPVASMVANVPATPSITTANTQTSAAAITAFSQGQSTCNPPPSHTQLVPASDQLSPLNRAYASSNMPIIPCHIIPFDQMQPTTQNVFHVHTADLQICLQIISDEQLALIEPQIERQTGSTLSQARELEAAAPEEIQNQDQTSVTMESSSEGRDRQRPGCQKECGQSECSPTLNMDGVKPQLCVQFEKAEPNLQLNEHSNSTQATVSAEAKPPAALGPSLRPHKYSHVNKVTETQSSSGAVMSTAAPLKGVMSVRSQPSQEEHGLLLNRCAKEELLLDRGVSQGGSVSQTVSSQHKLSVTSLSPGAVNQNRTRSERLGKDSQHKLKNQGALCNVDITQAKGEASAYKSNRLESRETHPPPQVELSQAPVAACTDELSDSVSTFSINKCKAPRQPNPQSSSYRSYPEESTLLESLDSSKYANMGCDKVDHMDSSAPLEEMTLSESQDAISSAHTEKQLTGQFTSVSSDVQVERSKDIPAMLTIIQSPTAGLMEGATLAGCAAKTELQTQGTPEQPDSTGWGPNQSQVAGETNHQCMEGQGDGGEETSGGSKPAEGPGAWGQHESNCRYTCLQVMMKPEGEEGKDKADSFKNSLVSEQHLQHCSQTHSGMSENPPQSPQQAPSTTNNHHLPASSQSSLFSSPQPPLEMNNFSFSQLRWESSITHNQQTQASCQSKSSHVISTARPHLTETQQAFSRVESSHQETETCFYSDQKVTAGSFCMKSAVGSHKGLSADFKTSSSTNSNPLQVSHSAQVSRALTGWTEDTQASTVQPSKPFTYLGPDDFQDTTNDSNQSSNSGRADMSNKYQSFFLAGQLHGYQPGECLTGGLRPVQSCQDYTEDTSSSDDEGKLIIEL